MAEIITTTGTQTGSSGPWSVQQPYLTEAFGTAQDLSKTPLRYGPNTVAPMGQATTNALNQIIGMGQNNPYLMNATNYFNQSVGGGFLPMPRQGAMMPSGAATGTFGIPAQPSNQLPAGWSTRPGAPTSAQSQGGIPAQMSNLRPPAPTTPQVQQMSTTNPYLDAMYAAAAAPATREFTQNVLPGIGANFGMSGRSGSPGMMNAIQSAATGYGEGMGNLAANLYGQAYEAERGRQQEMAMFAPNLIDAQLGLAGAGLEAGQTFDEQTQRELSDRVARFRFNQEEPWRRLERYMGNVSGAYGGQSSATTTQQQPIFESPQWMQYLGGAAALGQSGAFGNNGWLTGLLDDIIPGDDEGGFWEGLKRFFGYGG